MDLVMRRHAISDWRDRHIVAAAALVNLRATEARTAFDKNLDDAEFRGPMLDAQRIADARIDAYMRKNLTSDLDHFRSVAASELSALDERLRDLAEGLRVAPLDMPEGNVDARDIRPGEGGEANATVEQVERVTPSDASWFARLPGVVVDSAARAVGSANTAAGTTIFERSGAADRLRKAAAQRVQRAWMNDADSPPSPLSQMISLIDGTAHAARIALS